jgi:hypothetical protein
MKKYLYTFLIAGLSTYFFPAHAHQHNAEPSSIASSPHTGHSSDSEPSQANTPGKSDFMMRGEEMWQRMLSALSSATDHIYAYWRTPAIIIPGSQNEGHWQKSNTSSNRTIFGTPLEQIAPLYAQADPMSTNAYPTGIPLAQAPLGESDVRILSASEPLENEAEDESTQKKSAKSAH